MIARNGSEDSLAGAKISKSQLSFPISRVKKIIRMDTDIGQCQTDAVLLVTALSEVFVDYLTRQASRLSDSERRKTITYRDVACTVSEDARLAFLREIIPKTVTLGEGIALRQQLEANDPFPIDAGESLDESAEETEDALDDVGRAAIEDYKHPASDSE